MTARELIQLLSSDNGIWLDVKVVDSFCDEIKTVVLKSEHIQLLDTDDNDVID